MFLSGLVDLGLPVRTLAEELAKLHVGRIGLRFGHVRQKAIRARRLTLSLPGSPHAHAGHPHPQSHPHAHRSFGDIERLIRKSSIRPEVQKKAISIFRIVAEAEGKVHGVPSSKVHFHEVGALDSIIDIVGAAIGLEYFQFNKVYCSPLPLGRGFVNTLHGRYPVPAPATLEILKGFPLAQHPDAGEWTTPTGAAIAKAVAEPVEGMPRMKVTRIGYGSGSRMGETLPNVVRMVAGSREDRPEGLQGVERDEVCVMETDIDDMTPEMCAPLMDRLLARGALDVQWIPTHMKRGRPGFRLEILATDETQEALAQTLFEESSTIGLRFHRAERMKLPRRIINLRTAYGMIRAKVSSLNGRVVAAKPEILDVVRAAREHDEPLPRVLRVVQQTLDRHVRPR